MIKSDNSRNFQSHFLASSSTFALTLTLTLALPFVCDAVVPDAHKVCNSCHVEEGPPALKLGINDTCVVCHPVHPGRDHPVNVVSKSSPDKLPLGKEEKITCNTCHEPHGKDTSGKLLRMEFNKLCVVCHKE